MREKILKSYINHSLKKMNYNNVYIKGIGKHYILLQYPCNIVEITKFNKRVVLKLNIDKDVSLKYEDVKFFKRLMNLFDILS